MERQKSHCGEKFYAAKIQIVACLQHADPVCARPTPHCAPLRYADVGVIKMSCFHAGVKRAHSRLCHVPKGQQLGRTVCISITKDPGRGDTRLRDCDPAADVGTCCTRLFPRGLREGLKWKWPAVCGSLTPLGPPKGGNYLSAVASVCRTLQRKARRRGGGQ